MASEGFGYFGPQDWRLSRYLRWTEASTRGGDDKVPWVSVVVAACFFSLAYPFVKVPNVLFQFVVPANFEVWSFLTTLVGTGIIIAWAMICWTYLWTHFRKRCKYYGVEIVKETQSSFQPYLAGWGFFWSVMICSSDRYGPKLILSIYSRSQTLDGH